MFQVKTGVVCADSYSHMDSSLQQSQSAIDYALDSKSKFFVNNLSRCGSPEPVQSDHVPTVSDVLVPPLGGARFHGQFRDVAGKECKTYPPRGIPSTAEYWSQESTGTFCRVRTRTTAGPQLELVASPERIKAASAARSYDGKGDQADFCESRRASSYL